MCLLNLVWCVWDQYFMNKLVEYFKNKLKIVKLYNNKVIEVLKERSE